MMKNKEDKKMKIGDIVKSHDFPGRADCYYIGEVVSMDESYGGFKAKTIKVVVMDEVKTVVLGRNDYFTAPFNGNSFMDDMYPEFKRVVVVG